MDISRVTAVGRSGIELTLAPFESADVDRVYELCQDADIQRWTTLPSPYPRGAAEEFINTLAPAAWRLLESGELSLEQAGPELSWALLATIPEPGTAQETDQAPQIWGSIGLKLLGQGGVEVGWWLGREARGYGLMRAATAAVVQIALDPAAPINAKSVLWRAYVGNFDSARIAQRVGFHYTGLDEDGPHGPCWSAMIYPGDPIAPVHRWPILEADGTQADTNR